MKRTSLPLTLLLIAALLAPAAPGAAQEFTATTPDAAGDVGTVDKSRTVDIPGMDILAMRAERTGDQLLIHMDLAGAPLTSFPENDTAQVIYMFLLQPTEPGEVVDLSEPGDWGEASFQCIASPQSDLACAGTSPQTNLTETIFRDDGITLAVELLNSTLLRQFAVGGIGLHVLPPETDEDTAEILVDWTTNAEPPDLDGFNDRRAGEGEPWLNTRRMLLLGAAAALLLAYGLTSRKKPKDEESSEGEPVADDSAPADEEE
ncbi:MAG: hypothetical protein ACPGQL_09075 [Thermoplasmatota archaeon]